MGPGYACAVLVLVTGMSGCSAADEPTSGSTVQPSVSSPESPTADPTTTSSSSPDVPSSTVAVADGKRISLADVALTLPKGYYPGEKSPDITGGLSMAGDQISIGQLSFGEGSLDSMAQGALGLKTEGGMERQPDLTVDGVKGYVLQGTRSGSNVWEYGTAVHGQRIFVDLEFDSSKKKLLETVAAVIPTVELQ